MDRAYTVAEIDALRRAVDHHFLWGRYCHRPGLCGGTSRIYDPKEKAVTVEERVRTYMLAGITAEDLQRDEDERYEAFRQNYTGPLAQGMSGSA